MTKSGTEQLRGAVDLGRWQRQELLLGSLLPTALGISGIVGAVFGYTSDRSSVTERVIVGVLGLFFLVIGGGLLFWLLHAPPFTVLEVDDAGLTSRLRKGVDWTLPWEAVAGVSLVRVPAKITRGLRTRGVSLWVELPRHYLLLDLHRSAAMPENLRSSLGRHRAAVDLGVPARAARQAEALLGTRVTEPGIRRLDRAAAEPIRAA